jgi:choline monooxygenase
MDINSLKIEEDITRAHTLPAEFYRSKEILTLTREKVFARSWQLAGDTDIVKIPGQAYPFNLHEGFLNEPLLLTRDFDDKIHCLSNVCTHRGNLLIEAACNTKNLRCRYHGRRFDLNGRFKSMPEFDKCEDFPSEEDNLAKVPFQIWNNFILVSLNPLAPFEEFYNDITSRLSWFPFNGLVFEPSRSRDYLIRCNWALYVDNYLEGFHIPFVHSGLNDALDYGSYSSELYKYCNLQLGISKKGEQCFSLPKDSPDYGKDVAAYYYWVFPNIMYNFYPWGLSINIVKPLGVDLTKVSYLTYISDASKLDAGAGAGLDRVEREDEAIVEEVQRGITSRFYTRGRYSPTREQGVHHFHRLIINTLI